MATETTPLKRLITQESMPVAALTALLVPDLRYQSENQQHTPQFFKIHSEEIPLLSSDYGKM